MTEELYNAIAFKCLDFWMTNRENGKYIYDYLEYKGVSSVGIYGYGILGKHLVSELQNSKKKPVWVMDKKDLNPSHTIKIVHLEENENLVKPELIIVTSIKFFEEIEKELRETGYNNIRSIEEIVEVIYSWKKW